MNLIPRPYLQTTIITLLMITMIILPMTGAADPGDEEGGCWGGGGWNVGSWWVMATMMGIVAIGVIFLFVFLVDSRERTTSPPAANMAPIQAPQSDNPLLILDQRFSRGDISRQEYLQMKEDLKR